MHFSLLVNALFKRDEEMGMASGNWNTRWMIAQLGFPGGFFALGGHVLPALVLVPGPDVLEPPQCGLRGSAPLGIKTNV